MMNALKMLLPWRSDTPSGNMSPLNQINAEKEIKVLEYQDSQVFENSEDPPPPYSAVVHIDQKLASFLSRLNLTELMGLFAKEELSLEDMMKLSYEDLKEIGVDKLKQRKLLAEELEKIKMPLKVVLSSSGETAQHQRGVLGQYDYDVTMGHYVQTNTERDCEHYWAVYMYPDSDHTWWVGPCPWPTRLMSGLACAFGGDRRNAPRLIPIIGKIGIEESPVQGVRPGRREIEDPVPLGQDQFQATVCRADRDGPERAA